MINFFRIFRNRSLTESNVGRYLTYAIGEVILVVVGILIALQINNYNNYKQERAIEEIYLKALKNEFKNNVKILDETVELNNHIIDRVDSLIAIFQESVLDTISEETVSEYFFQAFQDEIHYSPSTGVLMEIISSGNLKLIQNQELKHRLASFESYLAKVKHQENEVNIPRLEIMEHFREQGNFKRYLEALGRSIGEPNDHYNFQSIFESRSNREMFTSLSMFNSLFFYQITSSATNYYRYAPLKTEMEEIIATIDSELNKK